MKTVLWAGALTITSAAALVLGIGVLAWLRVGKIPEPCDKAAQPLDIALVLSGGPDYRRTRRAIDLYNDGAVTRVAFTGAGHGGDSAPRLAREAQLLGVPSRDIVVENRARSTAENFRYSCALPALAKANRVAIVTDQFHAYRAWLTAKRQCADRIFCSAPAPLELTHARHVSEARTLVAYQLLRRATLW